MDNVPCYFFVGTYPQKILPVGTEILGKSSLQEHFSSLGAILFLPEDLLIHSQNAGTAIPAGSLFLCPCAILLTESEGSDMGNDRSRDPAAIYEEIIAILKAQVEEQERTIQAQDETIRVLQEHNEELAALLDHCCEDR